MAGVQVKMRMNKKLLNSVEADCNPFTAQGWGHIVSAIVKFLVPNPPVSSSA